MEYVDCNLERGATGFSKQFSGCYCIGRLFFFSGVLNAVSKTCPILWSSNLAIINILK